MGIQLPALPEPTEVEIELTNHCNAKCAACPREQLSAEKGYMDEAVFDTIIQKYAAQRSRYAINQFSKDHLYPIVTFAGMGEPLLHKKVFDFIEYARKEDFYSVLFTNASLLNEERAFRLANSGINHVYISFWGIKEQEYNLSMGLDYHDTLKKVEYFKELASKKGVPITIIWVQTEFMESAPEEINHFWRKRGIPVDNENDPWNRGGYLNESNCKFDFSNYPQIHFDKEIWCSQLYFTDTICWNGDMIICSCDYYKKENGLGNLMNQELVDFAKQKIQLLNAKQKIKLCTTCKKPDRNYTFGSEPWDKILDINEKQKYLYPGPPVESSKAE